MQAFYSIGFNQTPFCRRVINDMNKIELRKFFKNYPVDIAQMAQEEEFLLRILWDMVLSTMPYNIGLYAAIDHEIDLSSIFKKCQELKIVTAYPRITGDVITFHKVDSLNMLTSKAFGICEPSPTAPLVVPDLLIVPGLAFTKDGKRLGRGKGHYDRYLSQHNPSTVSLACSWALLDDLPTELHDIPVDSVISCPLKKVTNKIGISIQGLENLPPHLL